MDRTPLLGEIELEMSRSGVVVLCGPWGYGRTTLLEDYARLAHARSPLRPVARVEFGCYEAQAFLNGDQAPLARSLEQASRPRARLALGEGLPDGGRAPGAAPDEASGAATPQRGRSRGRRMPQRFDRPETRLVYETIASVAPSWCARVERGEPPESMPPGASPIVTVDDLPRMDEEAMGAFADALTAWSRLGASFLVACPPYARIPASVMPCASTMEASALGVSASELPVWMRELRIAAGARVEASAGVPLLVNACHASGALDPARDPAFLRAADRVVGHCLEEPMCASAERARRAIVMLGHGSIGDLAEVGAGVRDDELAILAESYPLLGIDFLTGSFSCVPVGLGRQSASVARAAGADEGLSLKCAGLLFSKGRLLRAAGICSLLSASSQASAAGRRPDAVAAACNGGLVESCVRMARTGAEDVDPRLRPGLARLVRLHALAHDVPERRLPELASRYSLRAGSGALRTVRAVIDFWESPRLAAADAGAPRGGARVEEVVRMLGAAGIQGKADSWLAWLPEAGSRAERAPFGLGSSVLAAHAAVSGMLCGRPGEVVAWLGPLAAAASDPDAPEGEPTNFPEALLGACLALARLLAERPSAARVAADAAARVAASRRFFDARGIEPAAAFARLAEAVCLILSGSEAQAAPGLEACRVRWAGRGFSAGQYAVGLSECAVCLSRDEVGQAHVHAAASEALARRVGAARGVWLARLLGSVAAIRAGSQAEVGTRLLEATMRQSASYPKASAITSLELGLLHAAHGDADEARDILQCVGAGARTGALRLLVSCVRGLGRSRVGVMELLPATVRAEYEGARPSPRGAWPAPAPRRGGVLAVSAFGGFRACVNGHLVGEHEWGRRKSRKILMMLALFPDEPLLRDELIDALWDGEERTATVRNNFNTLLSNLRVALGQSGAGPFYIVSTGKTVGLNLENVDVDVMRFETVARSAVMSRYSEEPSETLAACARAERLYRTGLAPEFLELPGRMRRRASQLSELFCDCMVMGSGVAGDVGDFRLAMWFASAARRACPGRADAREAAESAAIGLRALAPGGAARASALLGEGAGQGPGKLAARRAGELRDPDEAPRAFIGGDARAQELEHVLVAG